MTSAAGNKRSRTSDLEKKWEPIAGRFRQREIYDSRGARRDRLQGDEREAIVKAFRELGWHLSQLARLFERDVRTISQAIQAQELAERSAAERSRLAEVTLPHRRRQMETHYRQLDEACERIMLEVRAFDVLYVRRPEEETRAVKQSHRVGWLVNCLREHKPDAPVWQELAGWRRSVRRVVRVCYRVQSDLEQVALNRSDLRRSPDLRTAGINSNFWWTIYVSGMLQAKGQSPWGYEQQPGPAEGLVTLSYGTNGMAVEQLGQIPGLRNFHRRLARKFALSSDTRALVHKEKRLEQSRATLQAALEDVRVSGFSDGLCKVCGQWLS